jgi:hypothetical protein
MHEAEDALDRHPNDLATRAAWSRASANYYLGLHPQDAKWRRTDGAGEMPSVEEIRERAAVADKANRAIPTMGRIDPRPEQQDLWAAQLGWAEETLGEVYTDRFRAAEAAVKVGDIAGLEYCVRFLEADPWCFGSGYAKEALIVAIVRFQLDDETRERLQRAILTVVDDPRARREITSFGRLAEVVGSADLRAQLQRRLADPEPQVRYNADKVLKRSGLA